MTWEQIEALIAEAKGLELSDYLLGRQLSGEGNQTYYAFFRQLARANLLPEGIFLEIGCESGAVPAHVLDVVDLHNRHYVALDVKEIPFSHPNFIHLHGDSTSEEIYARVQQLTTAYGGVACVYHDSSHHYLPSVKEWELYSPLVNKGGLWVSDDLTPAFQRPGLDAKSMAEWWDDLPGDKRTYDDMHTGSRMGITIL